MKYFITILGILFSVNTFAGNTPDLSGIADPSSVNVEDFNSYKASEDSNYKGRNENRAVTRELQTSSKGSSLSRSVVTSKSNNNAQLENFESTVGELVQKVEDDRAKKSKGHKSVVDDSKVKLKEAYDYTKQINTDLLGNEQDPIVQNAFKCSNLRNCDTSENDSHAMPTCGDSQRLTWTGQKWECIGVFENPGKPNCDSTQWSKDVNGGTACIDYIYVWTKTGVSACQSTNTASHIYQCMRKKNMQDTGSSVPDENCFGEKPTGKDSCTYEGVWQPGNWSACTKTCGSGTQNRYVGCSTGYCNPATKPAVTRSCNTQRCPISASYSCSAYGSGWYLSGTNCTKAADCRYTYKQAPYGGAYGDYCQIGGRIGSGKVECYYGGRTVFRKNISDPSLGDRNQPYSLGTKKSNCTGQGCASGYTARHQVCLSSGTRAATKYCPGGWTLSGNLCY
ncbi:MAG TPA: hypothetical protein DCL21_04885 [Alphaproteobacteria bacterium]|nr:hypothetical protein [Alphaproteobacteria bacterium]